MNKVRLGILGMGNMGSCHLENILCGRCPEITVTAVCDLRPERLEAARARVTVQADGENPQHVGVLNAFAAAILRGEPLVADGREGLNSLMLTNAMHLSEWTRKPVELPFDEALHRDLLLERVKTSRRKELVGVVCSIEEVMESTKGGVG